MYLHNVICTVALATLASAAVAKQIPTPYSSESESYADEDDVDSIFARDAEAEADPARTARWEAAHGGAAPSYKFGEAHDAGAWHVAREAEAEPEAKDGTATVHKGKGKGKKGNWASWLAWKKAAPKGGKHNHIKPAKTARDVEDGEEEYDGDEHDAYLEELHARDTSVEDLEIPDFGGQEVDTSLEGLLEARAVDEDEEDFDEDDELTRRYDGGIEIEPEEPVDESLEDLTGYNADILERRSAGTEKDVDYSLEGFDFPEYDEEDDAHIAARDLNDETEEEIDADDDYLYSDEHREFLASHGVTERDAEDDYEDEEHDLIDRRDVGDDHLDIPDFGDEDIDTSLEGLLEAREAEIPDFGDLEVDTSLEGYDTAVYIRGVDEEDDEDEDEEVSSAEAAYAGAEVVEELVAPAVEARDLPAETDGKPVTSSRGFFRIPWS